MNNIPQPPTADAGEDFTVIEGHRVTLDGSLSWDAETEIWTYSWEQLSGPALISNYETTSPPFLMNPFSFIAPRNEVADILVFRLTVKNHYDLSGSDDITVTVLDSPVEPPVADAGDDLVAYNKDPATLDASGSYDAANGPLTYEWTVIPQAPIPNLSLTGVNPSFYIDFWDWYGGPIICVLVVTNEDGLKSADKITMDVRPSDVSHQRPSLIADAGSDQIVMEGETVVLDGSGSYDPFADTSLSYVWVQIDGPEVTLNAGNEGLGASFVAPSIDSEGGDLKFRLTVSNEYGLEGQDETTVKVNHDTSFSEGTGGGTCFISSALME